MATQQPHLNEQVSLVQQLHLPHAEEGEVVEEAEELEQGLPVALQVAEPLRVPEQEHEQPAGGGREELPGRLALL